MAAPEFAVEEGLIDFQAGGDSRKEGDQGLAVRFSGSEVAQHKFLIVPDGRRIAFVSALLLFFFLDLAALGLGFLDDLLL